MHVINNLNFNIMPTTKEKQMGDMGNRGGSHSHSNQSHSSGSYSGSHSAGSHGASRSHGDISQRGFASMNNQKQREIGSKGGKAAHESGHAHEFTSAEAREAGRKGGEAVSRDKEHMTEIGRKGGEH
jgi:general stress protein YciG